MWKAMSAVADGPLLGLSTNPPILVNSATGAIVSGM
jgi:hypothetical protein